MRGAIARIGILAVIFVEHAEVAVDVHIFAARRRAVRARIHVYGAFFREHGVRLGGAHDMGAYLAAAHGDMCVLVGLKRYADDIQIRRAVQREFRIAVAVAAKARVDAAHIVMRDVCALRRALDGRIIIPQAEFEIAVDRHLSSVGERYARHIVFPAAAASVNVDIDVFVEGRLRVVRLFDAGSRPPRLVYVDVMRVARACAAEEIQRQRGKEQSLFLAPVPPN